MQLLRIASFSRCGPASLPFGCPQCCPAFALPVGQLAMLAKTFYCSSIVPILCSLRARPSDGSEFDGFDWQVYEEIKYNSQFIIVWLYLT